MSFQAALHRARINAKRETFSHAAFVTFAAVVCLAPFPFGSLDRRVVLLWCTITAFCLIIAPKDLSRSHVRIAAGILLILSSVVVVAVAQKYRGSIVYRPVLGILSPEIAVDAGRLSPFAGLSSLFLDLEVLLLGLLYGVSAKRARILLACTAYSGVTYAVYGIVSAITEPTLILWRERSDYIGVVLGTFINRNTAATFFGSCAAIWWVLLCENVEAVLRGHHSALWSSQWHALMIELSRKQNSIRLLGFAVCFLALAMTNSRAGVICSVGGMGLATLLIFRKAVSKMTARWKLLAGLGLLSAGLVLTSVEAHRFDTQGFNDEGRFDVYRATWRMILDHPMLGTGFGTFQTVFPLYRGASDSIWGRWEFAHSTPIELAAEIGLPAAALICAGYLAVLALLYRGTLVRRRDNVLPLAAATVGLIGGLHTLLDFPLQVSGYAIVCMAMLGIGLGQCFRTHPSLNPRGQDRQAKIRRLDPQAQPGA